VVAFLGMVVLGGLGLIAGCGDEASAPPPFTASDTQVRAECLFGSYLPEQVGLQMAARPVPRDWGAIEDAPGTLQPDRAAAVLTIRPRQPGERLVLTGVRPHVERHPLRPSGTVFYRPCKRRLRGAAIEADVDGFGLVQASSSDPDGVIGTGLKLPRNARPIKFPWTIRLDRPTKIYFIAHSEHSFCTWSFRVSWHTDSSEGTIRVDNGGRGYTMTDTIGVDWNVPGPHRRWNQVLAPRWTGVR